MRSAQAHTGSIPILYGIADISYIGGSAIALLNTLRHLDRKNFYPIVILPKKCRFSKLLESQGFNTQIIPISGTWEGFKNRLTFFLHEHEIQLIHLITMRCFEFNIAMVARTSGIPVIWHMHFRFDAAFPNINTHTRTQILGLMHSLSSRIIACSNYTLAQFREAGVESRIIALQNGVDTQMFQRNAGSARRTFRKKFRIKNQEHLIGMVASIEPRKRPLDFIRTAVLVKKRFPAAKFILVGGGEVPGYLRKIQKASAGKVILTGYYERIPEVMHALDMLVLPSIHEPAALVLLEAMACRKPVIASNDGGNPEIVVNRKTGVLVPPKQPAAFAQAIIQLLQNPQKAREMGEKGYRRVKALFEIRTAVKKIESLYQDIAPQR